MGKPKRSGSGFSAAKQKVTKSSADYTAKEQQAAALINQGKLEEAEEIYRELIATTMNSHVIYGNLAGICWNLGKTDEAIALQEKA